MLLKKYILFFIIFQIHIVFGQSYTPKQTIDLKSDKEVLFGILGEKEKGIMVVSHNTNSKKLSLNFYSVELHDKWKISLKSDEYGYIDTYNDTKELYIYFTKNYIYLIHNLHLAYSKNTAYIIQIDYQGNYKVSKNKMPGNMLFQDYFVLEDKVNILCYEKPDIYTKKYFYCYIDINSLEFSNKKEVHIPDELSIFNPTSISDGNIEIINFSAGYKTDYSIDADIYSINIKNSNLTTNLLNVKLDGEYYPCPSYGEIITSNYYSPAACYTNILKDTINNQNFLYGLFTHNKNSYINKIGFYIKKFNFDNSLVLSKMYFWDDLITFNKDLSELNKNKNYNCNLFVDEFSKNTVFELSLSGKKNTPSFYFVLDREGNISSAFTSHYEYFQSDDRHVFNINTNTSFDYKLSPFYSGLTLEGSMKPYSSYDLLKSLARNDTKENPNVTRTIINFDDLIVLEYFKKDEKLNLYKFSK